MREPHEAFSKAELEAGRLLFAKACDFTAGVAEEAQLPPARLPEVAVLGRSNVGKSSLLNALTGRRALARVSVTPGRTQQLNFFELDGRIGPSQHMNRCSPPSSATTSEPGRSAR